MRRSPYCQAWYCKSSLDATFRRCGDTTVRFAIPRVYSRTSPLSFTSCLFGFRSPAVKHFWILVCDLIIRPPDHNFCPSSLYSFRHDMWLMDRTIHPSAKGCLNTPLVYVASLVHPVLTLIPVTVKRDSTHCHDSGSRAAESFCSGLTSPSPRW